MLSSFRQKKKSHFLSLPLCLLKTAALRHYKALLLLMLPPVFIGILNSTAYADITLEFYTYGSFDEVVKAFEKAALIFSDRNYTTLFPTLIGIGILFIACSIAFGGGAGKGSTTLISALIGITLFTSLVVPKGTIHVYDPVKNRYKAVGGVPDGLVLIAGLTNLVERSMIDIVTTSGDPVGYQTQAGGIGFDFLYNVHSKGILLADEYIHRNLSEYTSNCLFFELLRPNTPLSANNIAKNVDFRTVYALAASPAIYTQIYRDEDGWREGQSQTCQEAWAAINVQISQNATFEKATKARCADIGFDPAIPDEMSQCRTMITDFVSWFEGAAWDPVGFFRQTLMAQTYYESMISASPDVALAQMASTNTGTGYLASGMMANQWIPIIRGVLIGASILLTPFLVLFFPTSLVWRATALITGLFLWIMSWGIIDAFLHSYAMDRAYKVFEEIRAYELGSEAVAMFGTSSLKSLALVAAMRWFGLGLATVITGKIIKQGGSALAKLGGSLAGSAQSESAKAGIQTQTPVGVGSSLNSMVSSSAAVSFAGGNKWSPNKWSQRTQAAENSMSKDFGSGLGMGNMESAKEYGENKTSMDRASTSGSYSAYSGNMDVVKQVSSLKTGASIGQNQQALDIGKNILDFKGSGSDIAKQMAAWNEKGRPVDESMSKHFKDNLGKQIDPGSALSSLVVTNDGKGIASYRAYLHDGAKTVINEDGIRTTRGSANINGNAVSFMKKENLNTGEFIEHTATGKTNSAKAVEGKDGAKYNVEKGAEVAYTLNSEGNVVKTEYGKAVTADGKTGSIMIGADGKANWMDMKSGHSDVKSAINDTKISNMVNKQSGTKDMSYDVKEDVYKDNPFVTDSATMLKKMVDGDTGLSGNLLSGTKAEKETKAKIASSEIAKAVFLKNLGVTSSSAEAGAKIGGSGSASDGSGGKDSKKGKSFSFNLGGLVGMDLSTKEVQQIDKIASDYYTTIKRHQGAVEDGIWSKDTGIDKLSEDLYVKTVGYTINDRIEAKKEHGVNKVKSAVKDTAKDALNIFKSDSSVISKKK